MSVKKYYVTSKQNEYGKRIAERLKLEADKLVYLIEESSEDFEEDMKKGSPLENSTTLNEYLMDNFTPEQRKTIKEPKYFYSVTFNKPGGLVMPIIVEYTYADGTKKRETYPAQIWRLNDKEVSRTIASEKEILNISVDPDLETADVDTSNNSWPKEDKGNDFDKFKNKVKG